MLYKDLEIYNELRKVTVNLTYRVKDIPRKYKDTYGDHLLNYCFACLSSVIKANVALDKPERLKHLQVLSTDFDMLKTCIRLALECKVLPQKAFAELAEPCAKIGKCISSWINVTTV